MKEMEIFKVINKKLYDEEFERIKNDISGINKIEMNTTKTFYENNHIKKYDLTTTYFIKHITEIYSTDEYETQLKNYIYCWLDNCKDKISFKNLFEILRSGKIHSYIYSKDGLLYKYVARNTTPIIFLYYSNGYIYLLNDNKQFVKKKTVSKKILTDDDFFKKQLKQKINSYKRVDETKIKINYPNQNVNLQTITWEEAYNFIKEKNQTHCPFCKDVILYYNYKPRCLYQFSFDRIYNDEIHHINNIQITCLNCNILKKDYEKPTNDKINCCSKINCLNGCHIAKEYYDDEEKTKVNISTNHKLSSLDSDDEIDYIAIHNHYTLDSDDSDDSDYNEIEGQYRYIFFK